jgi:hypothetical protein
MDSVTSAGTFVTAAPGSYISSSGAAASAAAAGSGAGADGGAAGGVEGVSAVSLLLPGLRVRMGVASGMLGDKEDCLNCKVLEVARGMKNSDAVVLRVFEGLLCVLVLGLLWLCLHGCLLQLCSLHR